MKEYEITIWIDEDGKIEADAEGFEGSECLAELEKLLEGQPAIHDIETKPEFDAGTVTVRHKQLIKQRSDNE